MPPPPIKPPPKPEEWLVTENKDVLINSKTGMRKTKDMTPISPPPKTLPEPTAKEQDAWDNWIQNGGYI